MTDFWREARDARTDDPNRPGFRVTGVDTDDGGFMFVPGELLVTDSAAALLPELSGPEYADLTEPGDALEALGIQVFSYSGPVPLPDKADQLQDSARAAAVAAGEDPSDCRVALHHVLAGAPFFYRGGPGASPRLAGSGWASEPAWTAAPPTVVVLDTGVPIETPNGMLGKVVHGGDQDVDDRFPPGEDGPLLGAEAGHGAFICGVIARMSLGEVGIASFRVLDPDGYGTERDVVRGLRRVAAASPSIPVINMSLGGYAHHDEVPLGLDRALRGLPPSAVVVAAAGNAGRAVRPYWPAADPEVVAVASVTRSGGDLVPSTFSNSGPWVDVATLGEDILSLYGFGDFEDPAGNVERLQGWVRWSGTSFAAPIVAAEIAHRVAVRGISARAAWHSLREDLAPPDGPAPALAGFGRVYDPALVVGIDPCDP